MMSYEDLVAVVKDECTDKDLPDEIQTMAAVFQLQLKCAIRKHYANHHQQTYDRVIEQLKEKKMIVYRFLE